MPCPWAAQARKHPDATAVILSDGSRITWSDLDRRIRAAEAALPGPADGLLLHLPGRDVSDLVLLVAALRAGRDLLLVAPRLPEPEVEAMARRLDAVRVPASGASAFLGAGTQPAVETPMLRGGTRLLTSGSTGDPRWIRHDVAAHVVSATAVTGALGLGSADGWLWSLPMHHVGGLSILFRCALAGAALILPSETFWPLSEGVTHLSLVPTQLQDALDAGVPVPASLRAVLLGGAAVPAVLLRRAVDAGWPVRTSYGMTETASMVTLSQTWAHPVPDPPHAGAPLPHAHTGIEDGRVVVRSAALADGVADMDGCFATSDAGSLDRQGHLTILGRLDRVIISGGENIDPVRIERAIESIPGVEKATVIGIPDVRWGERPVAFVAMTDGNPPDATQLESHLRALLESYTVPDRILPFPSLPPGALKLRHADLRAAAARHDEE
ncbi:MAG: AMP-binding protein [Bacteroidetes bacterium]|nr:AMP-binding protein [Bacteroidota bacterium]